MTSVSNINVIIDAVGETKADRYLLQFYVITHFPMNASFFNAWDFSLRVIF